jgi:hypothetical protein
VTNNRCPIIVYTKTGLTETTTATETEPALTTDGAKESQDDHDLSLKSQT